MNNDRKQLILEKLAIKGTVGTVVVGGKRLIPKEVLELVKDNPGMTVLEAVLRSSVSPMRAGGRGFSLPRAIIGKIGLGVTQVKVSPVPIRTI